MPLAASPQGLGTPPTTTMRTPLRFIASSILTYANVMFPPQCRRRWLAISHLAERVSVSIGPRVLKDDYAVRFGTYEECRHVRSNDAIGCKADKICSPGVFLSLTRSGHSANSRSLCRDRGCRSIIDRKHAAASAIV